KDPETPISSLSRLQEASKNWKIKTPEVAIVDGNSLYRLKGHCDVPDNTWLWMAEELYASILGRGNKPESVFVLSCGQERNPVKEKPLEDNRPVLKRKDGDSETLSAFAP
ncbi:MAG: hypothetical protein J5I65_11840, partial [Aridibacter famidurans]|nr:hypothetical protein [Aridibacter famidurans]